MFRGQKNYELDNLQLMDKAHSVSRHGCLQVLDIDLYDNTYQQEKRLQVVNLFFVSIENKVQNSHNIHCSK